MRCRWMTKQKYKKSHQTSIKFWIGRWNLINNMYITMIYFQVVWKNPKTLVLPIYSQQWLNVPNSLQNLHQWLLQTLLTIRPSHLLFSNSEFFKNSGGGISTRIPWPYAFAIKKKSWYLSKDEKSPKLFKISCWKGRWLWNSSRILW